MNSTADPFYTVKDEVVQQVRGIRQLHSRWRELIDNPASRKDEGELGWTTDEIKSLIRSIGWDLTDLSETIQIVESNRAKFKIDDQELAQRKRFVETTKADLETIKRELTSPNARSKVSQASKGALLSGGDGQSRLDRQIEQDNDQFIQSQVQMSREIEAEQEVYIDALVDTMGTMQQIGHDMEDELQRHNALLDDLSTLADNTGTRLRRTMNDIDKLIESSSNTVSYTIIAVLILVVIGLFLALIYL